MVSFKINYILLDAITQECVDEVVRKGLSGVRFHTETLLVAGVRTERTWDYLCEFHNGGPRHAIMDFVSSLRGLYAAAPQAMTEQIVKNLQTGPVTRPADMHHEATANQVLQYGTRIALVDNFDPDQTPFAPPFVEAVERIILKKLNALIAVSELGHLPSLVLLEFNEHVDGDIFLRHAHDSIYQGVRMFFKKLCVSYKDEIAALNPHNVAMLRTGRKPVPVHAYQDEASDAQICRRLNYDFENDAPPANEAAADEAAANEAAADEAADDNMLY